MDPSLHPGPITPTPLASGAISLVDAAATAALGRSLAERLLPLCAAGQGPLLLLQGELGAGKTCLVQGLAEGLGIDEPITSPSFALAQQYRGQHRGRDTHLVHLDLYRLEDPAAADELLAQEEEEAAALGAVLAVEWAERLSSPPADAWRLRLGWLEQDRPEAGRLAWLTAPEP